MDAPGAPGGDPRPRQRPGSTTEGPRDARAQADAGCETTLTYYEYRTSLQPDPDPPEDRKAEAAAIPALVDVPAFGEALDRLGLMTPPAFRALLAGLPGRDPPRDSRDVARELVRNGALTAYQASAVAQGKSRGLLIGTLLVLEKLGAGGMGMVFKALDRPNGRIVALKLLPPSLTRDPGAVTRFLREAEAAASLRHPNVVPAREAGEHLGLRYLVMDYVPGRDLARIVRSEGPLPVDRSIDAVVQAARGLRAIHSLGIIHRDIKPSNLLLTPDGTVKILDLGLARLGLEDPDAAPDDPDAPLPDLDEADDPEAPDLTRVGMFMGTVDYTPPEQARDARSADHRSDLYSLGCTLHLLLTGRPPFPGRTVAERLRAHRERPAPSLRQSRPEVPSRLDALGRWMLAKTPEHRPQSAADVVTVLEDLLQNPDARAEAWIPAGLEAEMLRPLPLTPLEPSPLAVADRHPTATDEDEPGPYKLAPAPTIASAPRRPAEAPVEAADLDGEADLDDEGEDPGPDDGDWPRPRPSRGLAAIGFGVALVALAVIAAAIAYSHHPRPAAPRPRGPAPKPNIRAPATEPPRGSAPDPSRSGLSTVMQAIVHDDGPPAPRPIEVSVASRTRNVEVAGVSPARPRAGPGEEWHHQSNLDILIIHAIGFASATRPARQGIG